MARKILLADDSVTAQNMGRKILADAGYEVITVNNGSAALKRITEQRPDVIVLDVYMPGYSGLEVCQRLKEVGETARIPILLTVGKLEPFKPEEVKRVRADGFIVKPFEASELLSALSKLEDRIVPRAEASKPGRFARAAMEQVPYDKTMAIEEDTTWKNRIAFPSKKKAKEPEPDEPVETQSSKDLQSVIEKKIAETPASSAMASGEEERVDLGALAPAGLPKDVTPEEIAALAAAAAQMQGRIADGRYVPPAPAPSEPPKIEAREEPTPIEPPKMEAIAPPFAAESIAEQKPVEQLEAKESEKEAPASFADQILVSAHAERSSSQPSASSGNGSWPQQATEAPSDEPVTMAVATVTESKVQASRWTAVAVPLAPEEAAISLEQEMQKAYAAFAAAEDGHSAAKFKPANVSPTESIDDHEAVVAVPAVAAPEAAQSLAVVASAAAGAVAATEKLEMVASSATEKDAHSPEFKSDASEANISAAPEKPVEQTPLPAPLATESTAVTAEESSPANQFAKTEEPVAAEKLAEHSTVAEAKSEPEPALPVASEPSKVEAEHHEPDLASATAAAWATLEKLQGSDGNRSEASASSDSKPADTAAKAVAVGAESHPEDVTSSESDSDSVASIVDSVLADLRPKIVAEISKKLGKKK